MPNVKQSDLHAASPLEMTVHRLQPPEIDSARRPAAGRWQMFAVLAICAAPVLASYFTFYVVRPQSRTNYADLITPPREIPADLPLSDARGKSVTARSLHGQWLLVTVAASACDVRCTRNLVLMRQLRETLGREKERVDKVWLVVDSTRPTDELLAATGAQALLTTTAAVSTWLKPAAGHSLEEHVYLIDPMGSWMMRAPFEPDPAKFKRDIDRLLRAAASWDQPGR